MCVRRRHKTCQEPLNCPLDVCCRDTARGVGGFAVVICRGDGHESLNPLGCSHGRCVSFIEIWAVQSVGKPRRRITGKADMASATGLCWLDIAKTFKPSDPMYVRVGRARTGLLDTGLHGRAWQADGRVVVVPWSMLYFACFLHLGVDHAWIHETCLHGWIPGLLPCGMQPRTTWEFYACVFLS